MDWYFICKHNSESADHLLLHCEVVNVLWDEIFLRLGIAWAMPRRVIDLLSCWQGIRGNCQIAAVWKMECEHPSTPRQKKYVRARFFRSGWRIRKVPGRNACEIKMFHQEDAGLNVNIAKLAFAKGIWSYVCNMDNALLKYSAVSHPHSAVTAVTLIQKVCTISFRILLCALFFRDLFQVLFYLSFRTRMF
ncbi:hypothetical protein I3842_Q133900 [Carya illinoinensis]|uniref:START domain-containing protein n=1 Tax=Carya illinoinensis TaxID=32201 RepID=A0A922D6C0_CARIL|nr:hypothetical protein I3842_Q133900 [Carya illinoinensis]